MPAPVLCQSQREKKMPISALARSVTKRARRGLYAGKKVLSGNNVSEDGGNRTRRSWKPNAQPKALYSQALDEVVHLRVTAAALRNIDKAGGLDLYILNTKEVDLDSDAGLALKQRIQQRQLDARLAARQLLPPAAAALAADVARQEGVPQ